MKYFILLTSIIYTLTVPAVMYAQTTTPGTGSGPGATTCAPDDPKCLLGITGSEKLLPEDPDYIAPVSTENLSGKELILRITQFVLAFVGAIALLIFVIGGYMYITARGDESAVSKAKLTMVGAVIGMIIILGAWTAVITVLNLGP